VVAEGEGEACLLACDCPTLKIDTIASLATIDYVPLLEQLRRLSAHDIAAGRQL
jgi:hypothetical protein